MAWRHSVHCPAWSGPMLVLAVPCIGDCPLVPACSFSAIVRSDIGAASPLTHN